MKKKTVFCIIFSALKSCFFSSSSFHVIGLLICFQTRRHLSKEKLLKQTTVLLIFDNLQTLDQIRK